MNSARARRREQRNTSSKAQVGLSGMLFLLVFLSGFAALVYQLLWFRRLGFVFGNTVQAAATVLAAFMIGLGWGAHRSKAWVSRTRSPVRLFGLLEIGVGVYALLVPAAFALISFCYRQAAHYVPDAPAFSTALRFVMALLVLFLPTMFMGATLPVLAEAILRSRVRFATNLGLLYGCNTAGATLGVVACGFFLVPVAGVQLTNYIAAALNLVVGGIAILLARRMVPRVEVSAETEPSPARSRSRQVFGYLAVAALCGALALAFETVWFRALTLVLGSTTYSFAVMVACFLLGLALGASLLGRVADRPRFAAAALAASLAGIGVWTFTSMRIYNSAPEYFLKVLSRFNFSWNGMVAAKAAIGAIFLLPLAILSALAFTAVVRLIRDDTESAGRAVGAAFSVNALGSAAGAAVGGFMMLPVLGLERSLAVLGWVAVVLGVVIAWMAIPAAWPRRLGFALVIAAAVVLAHFRAAPWDPLLLSSGPYFSPWANIADGKVQLRQRLQSLELVLYREGVTATVDVKRSWDGRLHYSSGGKVEADTSPQSMVLQRMMGHIPMLLHPNPQRVLNIGLGAGVTAGALTCYSNVAIEVAEFEPAASDVAAVWAPFNHDVIKQRKYKLVVNDGRNHLLVTTNRYDVITSDPFEPVVAGAASLYTVDHFELARARLTPNGLMAQFLPLYELSPDDVMMILRTFVRVFPRSCVFFTGSDTVLLGLTGDAAINLTNVTAKMQSPEVRASLAEIGIDRPERLLDTLVIDIRSGISTFPDGPVNTDNHPLIEFSAPKNALSYKPDVNQKLLLDHFESVPAEYLAGLSPEVVSQVREGHEGLRSVLQGSVLRSRGDLQGGLNLLRRALQQAPANPILRNELSDTLVMLANGAATEQEGTALYEEALTVNPTEFWALYRLALRADAAKQTAKADDYMRRAFAAHPDSAILYVLRAQRADSAGNPAAACQDMEIALKKMPRSADFWRIYAQILERSGRRAEATVAANRGEALKKELGLN